MAYNTVRFFDRQCYQNKPTMTRLQDTEKSHYVRHMFGRIAKRYNLMNRLMTAGQDRRWRRFVIEQAQLPPGGSLLDLATGTGDIAFEALQAVPDALVIGADFSLPMMIVGQRSLNGSRIHWCGADALQLPFADESFHVVTSGYLMRNVIDIDQTLREKLRVLKPGGRIVILESSPPPRNWLRPLIMFYLKYVIPLLGRLIVGQEGSDAYHYLPESTQAFKTPQELAQIMQSAGFQAVGYREFMFGTMCVHWGDKAPAQD
jgi:demethylmenaquinone methyltransferase / 2-methoxy-6-polyprenyl-1,4-benzoquinol methylase